MVNTIRNVLVAMIAMTYYPILALAQDDPAIQLRTNGLYALAASPNIGLEIQTDLGLAWQLDYIGAWWNNNEKHRFFSNYAFQTEMRWYITREQGFPYLGHHIGAYGQMATYDFEFGKTGYQSDALNDTYALGVSYGYAKRLSRWLSLDFTVGIGRFSSKYDKYEPKDDDTGYVRTDTRRFTFFGPTKIEVSLVWNLIHPNKQSRKL